VLADVREGAVSAEMAERAYGVVVTPVGLSLTIDEAATQALRARMRTKQ